MVKYFNIPKVISIFTYNLKHNDMFVAITYKQIGVIERPWRHLNNVSLNIMITVVENIINKPGISDDRLDVFIKMHKNLMYELALRN